MRKIVKLIALLLLIISNSKVVAQTTVQIGTGTLVPANTLYGPVYRFSATSTTTASRSNIVFTAAELSAVGIVAGTTITSVQFNKTNSANFTTPASSYKMYMANTTNTTLATTLTWASILSTHTEVFSSTSFNIPLAAGWVTWTITPFVYTGGSLEIATECSMGGNGAATDAFKWEYTDGFADKLVGVASLGATLNGSVAAYKHRPNIKIDFLPNSGCSTPPIAGTATSTVTNVCSGSNFSLGLTGNSSGTGQTYQWQRSSTGNAPWVNLGASSTSTVLSTSQTATSFYRCIATCSSVSDTSISVQVTSPALTSGDFNINNALPTGGGNFQTFQEAINSIACGINGPVTFNVEVGSGPYNEQITIPQIFGANATNRVTFKGNGAIIQFDPVTANRHVIKLDGADYITLDSLDIRTTGNTTSSFGWGIHLTNGADYDSIKNCNITIGSLSTTQSNSAGIVASGSTTSVTATGSASYNVFLGNTISGGYQGIRLNGTATSLNGVKNQVIRNTIKDFYADGISMIQNDSSIIAFNDISRPTRTAVTTFTGIELGAGNIKCIIDGNKIHDTHNAATTQTGAAYGVFSTANDATVGNENRIINNLIYNFNSSEGIIYGLYNSGSDGVKYYHNTVVLDHAAATAGVTRGFYQVTAATNIDLRNNIIYINRGGTGIKYCVYFGTTTSAITSNNNVLYNISSAGTNGIGSFGTAGSSDLTAWKTANSGAYDQQSISVDPLFTDVNLQNYTPTEVTVDNIGANVGVSRDINGLSRTLASPDPGAFEVPPSVGVDLLVVALASPSLSLKGCYNTENVAATIRNNAIDTINFAIHPATVTVTVAGVINTVYTATVNTGKLAPAGTLSVTTFTPSSSINMVALGNYNFTINVAVAGDVNPANNILTVDREKLTLTGGVATATPETYCAVGGTPKLTSTDAEGFNSVKWQRSINGGASYTDIANSDTLIYTLQTAISQNTYFRMVAVCGANEQNSTADSVIINNPQILTSQGATRCGPGSVTLTANANGTADVKWYENQTGGSSIFTGTSFTTPTITSTKTYYAAASEGGGGSLKQLNALPLAGGNGCGAGNLFNLTPVTTLEVQGFILNVGNAAGVATPISVWYKTGTYIGSETTQANWTFHQTLTVNSAGPNQPTTVNINPLLLTGGQVYGIYINFEADYTNVTTNTVFSNSDLSIEVGAGVCTAFTSFNALRGFNGSVLYTTGCEGTRTPVTATITAATSITASTLDSIICNGANAALSVTSSNTNYTYSWTPVSQNGASINVTPSENTKYFVNALDAGTGCTALDSITVRVQPVPTLSSNYEQFCIVGGSATLSLTPSTGYASNTIQWQTSSNNINFTDITGANNSTYVTPTIAATTYYKALIKNGAGAVCSQPSLAILLNNPQVLTTIPASRCGSGTVDLSATGSTGTTLNWYAAPTGGDPLFTGSTFTTPILLDTTNYYVAASSGSGTVKTGKTTANSTATQGSGTTNFGLVFDALSAFELKSVVVYATASAANTSGTVTIDVVNSAGTVLHTKTVNVTGNPAASAVGERVFLNFLIQPGTNLKLRHSARSTGISGLLFEPSASAPSGNYGYPYVVPGVVSISTSTLTATPTNTARNDLYYYFYDWEVTTGCESARTIVAANVDTSASCNALPVGLLNFKGIKEGNINRLTWTTTTETNNAGFAIERSADGRSFSTLSFVTSKAENGNSATNINYNFNDTKILSGNNYYRLKQVDKDNKSTYSSIVLIKGEKVRSIMITGLYPNPATSEVKLSVESPSAEKVTIIVADVTGKAVLQTSHNLIVGSNTIQLPTANLANGNYFVKMICANGCETSTTKFVKQ